MESLVVALTKAFKAFDDGPAPVQAHARGNGREQLSRPRDEVVAETVRILKDDVWYEDAHGPVHRGNYDGETG